MRARAAGFATIAAAALAAGCGSGGVSNGPVTDPSRPVVASPIPATAPTPNPAGPVIPEGFLTIEKVAAKPPPDPDVRWIRSDGADLPAHLSPCRTPLASDRDRVAGRQLVLVATDREQTASGPRLWKSGRLVIYRTTRTAAHAVAELRTALTRCARHDEGDGVTTVWRSEPLAIGDEALFVGGQMYRGETPIHGHYRGVVTRQGRAIMTHLDFGRMTTPPAVDETTEQQKDARLMAARLAQAAWLRPTSASPASPR